MNQTELAYFNRWLRKVNLDSKSISNMSIFGESESLDKQVKRVLSIMEMLANRNGSLLHEIIAANNEQANLLVREAIALKDMRELL